LLALGSSKKSKLICYYLEVVRGTDTQKRQKEECNGSNEQQ